VRSVYQKFFDLLQRLGWVCFGSVLEGIVFEYEIASWPREIHILFGSKYMYIYICMCVCVCVCVEWQILMTWLVLKYFLKRRKFSQSLWNYTIENWYKHNSCMTWVYMFICMGIGICVSQPKHTTKSTEHPLVHTACLLLLPTLTICINILGSETTLNDNRYNDQRLKMDKINTKILGLPLPLLSYELVIFKVTKSLVRFAWLKHPMFLIVTYHSL
jgi:hypothetical protein